MSLVLILVWLNVVLGLAYLVSWVFTFAFEPSRARMSAGTSVCWNWSRMIVLDSFDYRYNWPTARILELSVGIICSCLPVTTPIFRKHNLGLLPFAKMNPIHTIRNTFHRKKDPSAKKVRLETSILGSAFGDGKFLKTEDLTMNKSSRCEEAEGTNNGSRHLDVWVEPTSKSYRLVIHLTSKIPIIMFQNRDRHASEGKGFILKKNIHNRSKANLSNIPPFLANNGSALSSYRNKCAYKNPNCKPKTHGEISTIFVFFDFQQN